MYELSRVNDLLNPCRFTDTIRQQAYTQAQLSDVGPPGGQLRFSLPNNTTLDLSDAYVDFDIVSVNETAETAYRIVISRVTAPDGGRWQIIYDGSSMGGVDAGNLSFAFNTPFTTVITAMNSYFQFNGEGFLATQVGADVSFAVATTFTIDISRFSGIGQVPYGFSVTSALTAAGVFVPLSITSSVQGLMRTPRVEKCSPLFNRVYVQVNGTTVFDVQGANRLYSALNFLDPEFDTIGKSVEDAYFENGVTINGRRKIRFFLNWIDLFQSIFPLDLLPNAQIILYMDLELPNLCLICSNATNSANQSYRIQNAKIKYHTLQLPQNDKNLILSELDKGLTIPFLNWVYFSDTLNAGTVNKQSIFNPSVSNMLGVLFVMVDQANYSDATVTRKLNTFLRNNINTYRLKVGNYYFPIDKVESSNTYYSLAEQARELIIMAEVLSRKAIVDDMEVFSNFSGTILGAGGNLVGNDPSDKKYDPWFDVAVKMKSVFGITTADLGFSDKTHLCQRIALQGIDTSVLPNVVLELEGMSVTNNNDLNIFSLSQDYIIFYKNKFVWKH